MKTRAALKPIQRAIFPAECWFGEQVTQQICRHHQRRLRRIGWTEALDPPAGGWAGGDFPPRPGNALEVLIDGAQALPAIAAALTEAQLHVHLTGWHFTPAFALDREGEPLVPERCWPNWRNDSTCACSPGQAHHCRSFGPPGPTSVRSRDQLVKHTKIQCALD